MTEPIPNETERNSSGELLLVFDTSVDTDRVEAVDVIDPDPDGATVTVQTVRTAGPIYHVHCGGDVTLESPKTGTRIPGFGTNARLDESI